MNLDLQIIDVIKEEFDKLIAELKSVVRHQQTIIDDHEKRLRYIEKFVMGGLGVYTAFSIYKEFFK